MGPRMTYQQGIELLKSHRSRTENNAIYQQLSTLHEAIANIKFDYDAIKNQAFKTAQEVKDFKVLFSEQQGKVTGLRADVESTSQWKKEIITRTEGIESNLGLQKKDVENQLSKTNKDIVNAHVKLDEVAQEYSKILAEHTVILARVDTKLAQKAENSEIRRLQEDLGPIPECPETQPDQTSRAETVVLVRQSVEPSCAADEEAQRPNLSTLQASPDSLFDHTLKVPETPRKLDRMPTSCDEHHIDIRELSSLRAIINPLHICGIPTKSLSASTGALRPQYDVDVDSNVNFCVDTQHRRQSTPDTPDIDLDSASAAVYQTVTISEAIVLQRLIDEIKNSRMRLASTWWLNATEWTFKEFEKFQFAYQMGDCLKQLDPNQRQTHTDVRASLQQQHSFGQHEHLASSMVEEVEVASNQPFEEFGTFLRSVVHGSLQSLNDGHHSSRSSTDNAQLRLDGWSQSGSARKQPGCQKQKSKVVNGLFNPRERTGEESGQSDHGLHMRVGDTGEIMKTPNTAISKLCPEALKRAQHHKTRDHYRQGLCESRLSFPSSPLQEKSGSGMKTSVRCKLAISEPARPVISDRNAEPSGSAPQAQAPKRTNIFAKSSPFSRKRRADNDIHEKPKKARHLFEFKSTSSIQGVGESESIVNSRQASRRDEPVQSRRVKPPISQQEITILIGSDGEDRERFDRWDSPIGLHVDGDGDIVSPTEI